MGFNDVVAALLKSPLHGLMSGTTLLLTVTGRKSGRLITTPVEYVQTGDTLRITSRAERTWWRNLVGGGPVRVLLRGQEQRGRGIAISGDDATVAQALQTFLMVKPAWASRYGVRRDADGRLNADDLARAAADRVVVEITLDGR
jgi:hypothetical protein